MTTTEQHVPETPAWSPGRPKLRPVALAVAWIISAVALLAAAEIVPGAAVNNFGGALAAAAAIAVLNAIVPPLLSALRLPFMLLTGFVLMLVARRADAARGRLASRTATSRSTRSGRPSGSRSSPRPWASSWKS